MMELYFEPFIWLGIVAGGIVGCLATALAANVQADVPISAVAANWAKHVWSVLFVVPVPWIVLALPYGYPVAFIWLLLAPTIASKVHFGPKDAPWTRLLVFHAAFAAVALLTFWAVSGLTIDPTVCCGPE